MNPWLAIAPGFEVSVENQSFGEMAVGCFVVSFHLRRRVDLVVATGEKPRPVIQSSKRSRS
jgi:hypothetical protein